MRAIPKIDSIGLLGVWNVAAIIRGSLTAIAGVVFSGLAIVRGIWFAIPVALSGYRVLVSEDSQRDRDPLLTIVGDQLVEDQHFGELAWRIER